MSGSTSPGALRDHPAVSRGLRGIGSGGLCAAQDREKSGVPDGASASTIITRIAQTAIMVFFAIMATRLLGFPEITHLLDQVLVVAGRVVFGGA